MLRARSFHLLSAERGHSQGHPPGCPFFLYRLVSYPSLTGVLVVIAIIAITLFRPKIQELWDAIANGINGL